MADMVEITPRQIFLEDIAVTDTPGETEDAEVLGAGTVTLTKVPLTLLTQLVSAAGDAAAGGAGVAIGDIYLNTLTGGLRARQA